MVSRKPYNDYSKMTNYLNVEQEKVTFCPDYVITGETEKNLKHLHFFYERDVNKNENGTIKIVYRLHPTHHFSKYSLWLWF